MSERKFLSDEIIDIFDEGGENPRHIARLDYIFGDGWENYASGYKEAGDILAEYAMRDTAFLETLLFPIFFSYRQYVELRLKTIIVYGRELLHEPSPFPQIGTHDLARLWEEAQKVIKVVWPEADLDVVNGFIQQFHQVDPGSFEFRYPVIKKDGSPNELLKTEWRTEWDDASGDYVTTLARKTMNIRRLKDTVQILAGDLDGAVSGVSAYLDEWRTVQSQCCHG